jgi:hypothetical protein
VSMTKQQIALKKQELDMRRLSIRQHRQALREDSLQYCRRPSTLLSAALSGFVLGRLLPPLLRPRKPQPARLPSRLLDPFVQMIPVLVFERVRHALQQRTKTPNHRENP